MAAGGHPGRRLSALRGHLDGPRRRSTTPPPLASAAAAAALPSPSESAATGLHGLTAAERYYFEVNGYLVVPDMIEPQLLAELNDSVDACADRLQFSQKLAGDVSLLQGEQSRKDTGDLMSWPAPWCDPFRRLLSHRRAVRILLDLVGPGFHYSSANGIIMDKGAEGITMHGGQRSDGSGGGRDAWTYTIDRNGQIECNLITFMYQLTDIGPNDGGRLHPAITPAPTLSLHPPARTAIPHSPPATIRASTPATSHRVTCYLQRWSAFLAPTKPSSTFPPTSAPSRRPIGSGSTLEGRW